LSHVAAKPRSFVLLGPPGSGKGTQGKRLAADLGLNYLSTGAWLRQQVELATPLGKLAAPILERGEYLPDALIEPMVEIWLSAQTGAWVLDGFPRSVSQAVWLDHWLRSKGQPPVVAISLEGSAAHFETRIHDRRECQTCGWAGHVTELLEPELCPQCRAIAGQRADDHAENFRSRHAQFLSQTGPVVAHYRAADQLQAVSGIDSQAAVAAAIRASLPLPALQPISPFPER
jgi:adenylate kinase